MLKLLLAACALFFLTFTHVDAQGGTLLALPEVELCKNRPKEWVWEIKVERKNRPPKIVKHAYYFSWNQEQALGKVDAAGKPLREKLNWLEARNECRKRCMDTIGMETQQENELLFNWFKEQKKKKEGEDVQYLWTSGRLCDFTGCETREDLKPIKVNGWFFSNTNTKTAPTNKKPKGWRNQPWSHTGHKNETQPDNAEFDINQTPESCLAVLNNLYNDGIKWHDIACYHKKPFICEDSDLLLEFIESTHPRLKLKV